MNYSNEVGKGIEFNGSGTSCRTISSFHVNENIKTSWNMSDNADTSNIKEVLNF